MREDGTPGRSARPSPLVLTAIAVGILLLNDHVLKSAVPGAITGKLSDFAGVFALAVFAVSVLPVRAALACAVVGAGFIVWKGSAIEPFLALWNRHSTYQFARVQDPTDLLALAVLPFAARNRIAVRRGRGLVPFVALSAAAVFAFAATSVAHYRITLPLDSPLRNIHVQRSLADTAERLQSCGLKTRFQKWEGAITARYLSIETSLKIDGDSRDVVATALAEESNGVTALKVETVVIQRQTTPVDEREVLSELERRILGCLNGPRR